MSKIKMASCNHQADHPQYVWLGFWSCDLQVERVWCHVQYQIPLVYDAKCFYWDQISLNSKIKLERFKHILNFLPQKFLSPLAMIDIQKLILHIKCHDRSQTLKSDEAKLSKPTRITPVGSFLGGNTHNYEKTSSASIVATAMSVPSGWQVCLLIHMCSHWLLWEDQNGHLQSRDWLPCAWFGKHACCEKH